MAGRHAERFAATLESLADLPCRDAGLRGVLGRGFHFAANAVFPAKFGRCAFIRLAAASCYLAYGRNRRAVALVCIYEPDVCDRSAVAERGTAHRGDLSPYRRVQPLDPDESLAGMGDPGRMDRAGGHDASSRGSR